MTPQLIYRVVQNRYRQAGIAEFTPHDLRRSHISDLLDEGVDLAVIARQVGHTNVQTTARYDRRDRRAQRAAAGRLDVPFHVYFCAPGKGCEKGSAETGVKYVRNNVFRPLPHVESCAALNRRLLEELDRDLDARTLADGRSVRDAWTAEREHLRSLPLHPPPTCRTLARVADKFGHVRVDRVTYSLPIPYAYRPTWAKLFHDRVELAVDGQVVAQHERSFEEGALVLDPRHVLPLLERKSRAVGEATALLQWKLPPVFHRLREALRSHTRRPDREWVQILRLLEAHPESEVEAAVAEALERGSPRLETVRLLLRRRDEDDAPRLAPAPLLRPELATLRVEPPALAAYDALWGGA